MRDSKIKKWLTALIIAAIIILLCALAAMIRTSVTGASEYKGYKDTAVYETAVQSEPMSVIHKPDYWYMSTTTEAAVQTVEAVKQLSRYELTDEEKRMLCYVSDSEDHTSISSRQGVMQVVMNRVASDKFPDSITDVLYAPKQFQVMKRYNDDYIPSEEALEALECLLRKECIFGDEEALFFARADVPSHKIARGLELVAEIGGSAFYKQK